MRYMNLRTSPLLLFIGLLTLLLGCSQVSTQIQPTATGTRTAALTPFTLQSPTPSPSVTPIITSTQEPLLPTPTPFTYSIQKGDTLFGLALRFDTTVDEIVAANPDTNTAILSVGTELIIPTGEEDSTTQISTPTPVPVALSQPRCYSEIDVGLICYVQATNQQNEPLENLSALINLHLPSGEIASSRVATPPINILNPDESIPLSARFPAPVPETYQAFASLLTALPGAEKRPSLFVQNVDRSFQADRRQATLSGNISTETTGSPGEQSIWLIAVAYDAQDDIIGHRKRVYNMSGAANQMLAFEINIYSLGPPIERISLYTERH